MNKKKVLIMGAAGRDFHNFNTFFRDNDNYQVVAFTATQIPVSYTHLDVYKRQSFTFVCQQIPGGLLNQNKAMIAIWLT